MRSLKGSSLRVCVDGKQVSHALWSGDGANSTQRLTSIQRFLDGQLPYIQSRKLQWYYTTPQSTKNSRLQVPDEYKKVFAAKPVACGALLFKKPRQMFLFCDEVEYMALTPELEREIFQRVQLGMPLTTSVLVCLPSGRVYICIQGRKTSCNILPAGRVGLVLLPFLYGLTHLLRRFISTLESRHICRCFTALTIRKVLTG